MDIIMTNMKNASTIRLVYHNKEDQFFWGDVILSLLEEHPVFCGFEEEKNIGMLLSEKEINEMLINIAKNRNMKCRQSLLEHIIYLKRGPIKV